MFIVIEGPNGSGKTSIIKKFSDDGVKTLFSPGSTTLSNYLRPLCRGTDEWVGVDPHLQFLGFSLARVDEYLRLVHGREELIVTDRWWTSTYVYQCCIENFPVDYLNYTIHPNEKIDKVYILTAKDDILLNRMRLEREKNPDHKLCKWTTDNKLMTKINKLYTKKLSKFLQDVVHIDVQIIDTSDLNLDDVYKIIKSDIDALTENKNDINDLISNGVDEFVG